MLEKEELKKLREIFCKYENIKAAYLFGSYAENRENKFSDEEILKGFGKLL